MSRAEFPRECHFSDEWVTIHEVATEIVDELDEYRRECYRTCSEFSAAVTVAIKRLGLMDDDEEEQLRAECDRIFKARVSA